MKPTQIRKSLQAYDVWMATAFCAAISVISIVANVYGRFASGGSDAGMTSFLCFLPMAFFYAAVSHQQTRERIKVLEARIHQLEADKAAAS
ncbi:hypothetical protein ACYOEI_04805 [Singulisphaera rosea]